MAESRPSLLRSSALITAGVFASRISGLLRVIVLLAVLGATDFSDAYNFANNVPNLVYELVAGGALSAVLLPLFVDLFDRGDRDGASSVVSVSVVALAVITVLGVLAAAPLGWAVAWLGGNEAARGPLQDAVTVFVRWFMPQVFFYGLMTVTTAVLQSRRRFGAAAFAPLVNNAVTIAAFLLAPAVVEADLRTAPLGSILDERWAVTVLGLGTTLGVVANAALLLPALRGLELGLRFRFSLRDAAIGRLIEAARGALGFVLVTQVSALIATAVAWRYARGGGEYSAYTYANLFFFVVYGLLAVSITTAIAPELVAAAQRGDLRRLGSEWARGLRFMTLLVAPAAAGVMVLSLPVSGLLPLPEQDAIAMSHILIAYGPGLFAYAVFQYVVRAFYALEDTGTPFRLVAVQQAIVVVLGFVLSSTFGIVGLAVAFSTAYVVSAVLGFRAFALRIGRLPVSAVGVIPRIVAAAVSMAIVVAAVVALLGWGGRELPNLVVAVVGIAVGVGAYLAYLWGLRADGDLQTLVAMLRSRLGR